MCKFVSGKVWRELIFFVPDITINCDPPYVKGKSDSCWIKYRPGKRPETKKEWESALGMSIQSVEDNCFNKK